MLWEKTLQTENNDFCEVFRNKAYVWQCTVTHYLHTALFWGQTQCGYLFSHSWLQSGSYNQWTRCKVLTGNYFSLLFISYAYIFSLLLKPFSHFLRKCSISGKVPTKPLLQEGGKSSSQPLLFECYVCFKLSAITVSTFLKHSCSLLKSSKNTFSPHMRDILAASNQDFSTWTQTIVQNWHQF